MTHLTEKHPFSLANKHYQNNANELLDTEKQFFESVSDFNSMKINHFAENKKIFLKKANKKAGTNAAAIIRYQYF